jgi:hypothetical protein
MHQILGPLTVNVGSNYYYTVSPNDGTSYYWSVTGGTIVSGQNTSSIQVHFVTAGTCTVQVNVTNGEDIVVIDPVAD